MARCQRLAPLEWVDAHGTPTFDCTVKRAEPVCPVNGPNERDHIGYTNGVHHETSADDQPTDRRSPTGLNTRAPSTTGPAP